MEQLVPLGNPVADKDIHTLCMYGHKAELEALLGIVTEPDPSSAQASPGASDAEAGSDDEDGKGSPRGSDLASPGGSDLEDDSHMSPPGSPAGSPSPGQNRSRVDIDVDSLSVTGATPLLLCAQEGHSECLKIVLDQGVSWHTT